MENQIGKELQKIIEAAHRYNTLTGYKLSYAENGDLVIQISKEEQYWRLLGE